MQRSFSILCECRKNVIAGPSGVGRNLKSNLRLCFAHKHIHHLTFDITKGSGKVFAMHLVEQGAKNVRDFLQFVSIFFIQFQKIPWNDWGYDPFSWPPKYAMSIDKSKKAFWLENAPMNQRIKETVDWHLMTDRGDSAGYEFRDEEVRIADDFGEEIAAR